MVMKLLRKNCLVPVHVLFFKYWELEAQQTMREREVMLILENYLKFYE